MNMSSASSDGTASEILSKITASTESLAQKEPGAREKLLSLSHQLIAIFETPSETIQRIGWAEVNFPLQYRCRVIDGNFVQPARFAAIRLAVELKIFDILEQAGDAAVKVSQLASSTGAESPLIGKRAIMPLNLFLGDALQVDFLILYAARTMKHLSAMNVVKEPNVDEFTSTHLSKSLTIPKYRDGISYWYELCSLYNFSV